MSKLARVAWRVEGARPGLVFTIPGAPTTKKTSNQVGRAGGKVRVFPSARFRAWEKAAISHMRALGFTKKGAIKRNVEVSATFFRERRAGDLVGYMQALADVLEKAGVIENDRQIVSWDGARLAHDKFNPRTVVAIYLAAEEP